ncbi:hypothetical protein CPB84DRAFT_1789896 [Gymnopilus junonius]|uniref:Uncharacterized protein n=1 Tax=Gymnopilus junonius TaxID=109634 RepID=A0A9P5NHF0_GYMJU|nr:hypothetical protein CPB84DRAFT_1789896 [Gymnopilus junonius]
MFIPLPSADVCDQTSPSSLKIAQTVSRTWYNLDPSLWYIVPERITFHPDGKGTISSPYTVYSRDGTSEETMSQDFKWRLARDGPLGMEGMDHHALFDTIPKLIRSDEAWTPKAWTGGFVPAYIHLDLVGVISSSSDLSSSISDPFIYGPIEDSDVAANELTTICKRSREMVMRCRRQDKFSLLVKRFAENGIALWITCGHFHPVSGVNPNIPNYIYAMQATFFKFPPPCGYPEPQGHEWQKGWIPDRIYHSCRLPLPQRESPTFWRRLHGDHLYDAHPEVEKTWL